MTETALLSLSILVLASLEVGTENALCVLPVNVQQILEDIVTVSLR